MIKHPQPQNDIPGWAHDIPAHVGHPPSRKPDKCSACVVPIWRWDGTQWVCVNCLIHLVRYDRLNGLVIRLEDCKASGVWRSDDPWMREES